MNIGLYNLKYPLRKLLGFLLPLCRNVSPNAVSYSLIPLGVITAANYFFAPKTPFLYLLGALFICIRMVIGTLDGLMAVTFNKGSAKGEIINRVTPEICDILLITGLVYSSPTYTKFGIIILAICWAVTFFGLVGIVGGKKIQSVGPVGQTDRIAALALCSVLQYFNVRLNWNIDFIYLFFIWVVIGSGITLWLRASRILKT